MGDPQYKYYFEGLNYTKDAILPDGTYELCGPKIQGDPEKFKEHILINHKNAEILDNVPRTYDGIKEYLRLKDIEGIVWHRGNGDMVKIKKKDFGFKQSNIKKEATK